MRYAAPSRDGGRVAVELGGTTALAQVRFLGDRAEADDHSDRHRRRDREGCARRERFSGTTGRTQRRDSASGWVGVQAIAALYK
jgi:hypothetical protein